MIIDNGSQVALSIPNVFDGTAGLAKGMLAFIPNGTARRPDQATRGTIDGRPVTLAISRMGKGPMYVATYREI